MEHWSVSFILLSSGDTHVPACPVSLGPSTRAVFSLAAIGNANFGSPIVRTSIGSIKEDGRKVALNELTGAFKVSES